MIVPRVAMSPTGEGNRPSMWAGRNSVMLETTGSAMKWVEMDGLD